MVARCFVEVDRDRRVEGFFNVVRLHPANGNGCSAVAQYRVNNEIGGLTGDVQQVPCEGSIERRSVQGGHRQWHFLQILLPFLRGHDHFFNTGGNFPLGVCQWRRYSHKGGNDHCEGGLQKMKFGTVHGG